MFSWSVIWTFLKGVNPLVYIAIACGCIYFYQQHTIDSLREDLTTCKTDKKTLSESVKKLEKSIEDQNKAIEELNKKFLNANVNTASATSTNRALQAEVDRLKSEITNRPLPKSCSEAADELRATFGGLSERWNKK